MLGRRDILRMLLTPCVLPALTLADEEKARTLKGWGEVVDPDNDCKFDLLEGRLIITVPGTLHDLSAEFGDTTAPRVLRDVEGDFVATVKVAGKVRHEGGRTSLHYLSYHGAGLLLWIDEKNYIRLERAVVNRNGGPIHYVDFAIRQDAKVDGKGDKRMPDQPTWLRLRRQGSRVFGAASRDGKDWIEYDDPFELDLPGRLRVGVAAVSTSSEELVAVFEDFSVNEPKGDRARP